MPDLEKHRTILVCFFEGRPTAADQIYTDSKRSLKRALHRCFCPDQSVDEILDTLASTNSADENQAIKLVNEFLYHHAPNDGISSFLQWVKKHQIDLDKETQLSIKSFKRVPKKIDLDRFFQIIQSFSPPVIAYSLQKLIPFGKQCDEQWMYVEYFMHTRSIEQIKMAIRLLQHMPKGYPKSARRFNLYMDSEPLRLEILKTLLNRLDLSIDLVRYIVESCIESYRRRSVAEGYSNDLLIEFNLIRRIYANYGIPITLPDIKM